MSQRAEWQLIQSISDKSERWSRLAGNKSIINCVSWGDRRQVGTPPQRDRAIQQKLLRSVFFFYCKLYNFNCNRVPTVGINVYWNIQRHTCPHTVHWEHMDGWMGKGRACLWGSGNKLQATGAICWSYFIFRTLVVVFTCVTLSHSVNGVCHNTEFFWKL